MCVLLITRLLRLVGRLGSRKPVGLLVTPTDRPKSVRNCCVIEVFGGVCVCCPLVFEFSVGIGVFVIGLGQISFFFSLLYTYIHIH